MVRSIARIPSSLPRIMAKASAAHLCPDRFAVVVVDGTSKRWKVVSADAGEIATAPEGENQSGPATAALANALKKARAPREPFVLSVSSSSSVFRNLQLPFTGDDAIRKVLKFESESHFHQLNIDDVIVDYVTVEEHKSATDLIVAAAPKKSLKGQIESLDRAGFDPTIVDLDAFSLFNAVIGTSAVAETGSSLVVHVGREETIVLLIEDRKLRTARSMRTGLATMQQSVAQDLGINNSVAAQKVQQAATAGSGENLISTFDSREPRGEIEKSPAELERDIIEERKQELVKRLQRELLRTSAAEARKGPDEVLVCGEGAAMPGLIDALGAAVQAPARELDLFTNVDGAPADPAVRRRCSVALGAAMRGIGIDIITTNFRQEELRFAKKLESLKVPLAVIAGVTFFTLLLQNIYTYRELDAKQRHLENIAAVAEGTLASRAPKKAKKYPDDPPAQRMKLLNSYLDTELRNLKNLYGSGGSSFSKPQSAYEALQRVFMVMQNMQDDMGLFVLDRFAATTNTSNPSTPGVDVRMTITFFGDGETASQHCSEFRKRMKASKWCVDTAEGTATPLEGGGGITYEGLSVKVDLTREQTQ
jgi:Tfp pilus assembly PilM family ATPase